MEMDYAGGDGEKESVFALMANGFRHYSVIS